MFAAAGTSASSRLSVNCSDHSLRSRKRFPAAPLSSLFFVLFWWILVDRTSFPIPLRHVVNLLESKKYLMSPAEKMWRTNLSWYLVAITAPQ